MRGRGNCLTLALVLLTGACAPLPQRTVLDVQITSSVNHGVRRPNFVILHYTSSSDVERALNTLRNPLARVSAHYLIGRDGRIYHLVDENARAWHAGSSYWGGNRDLNSASIGIELDNNGEEPYAEPLIVSLLNLLDDLKTRHAIPTANFLGHSDVAPARKIDPGRHFPWRRLAAHGFGHWCEQPIADASGEVDNGLLLSAYGYDVSDYPAAVRAFKLRFSPDEQAQDLTAVERGVLRCLLDMRSKS